MQNNDFRFVVVFFNVYLHANKNARFDYLTILDLNSILEGVFYSNFKRRIRMMMNG